MPRHRDGSRTGKLEISFSFHIGSEDFFIFILGTEKVNWILCPVDRLMNLFLYHVKAGDIDLKKNKCDRMRMANVIEQTKAEPLSGLWLSSMGTKMQ